MHMEKSDEMRTKAVKYLKIADHILTQTYPLVNDPKLLLVVLEDIFLAISSSMSSILWLERENKELPSFDDSFDSKFNSFKLRVVPKYGIEKPYIMFLQDMKDLVSIHKKSPVEFSAKGSYVMANDDYDLSKLTLNGMKSYMEKAKFFIKGMDSLFARIKERVEK